MRLTSALSRLFDGNAAGPQANATPLRRNEPVLARPAVALPALPPPASVGVTATAPQARWDLRHISPRQFAEATHELYVGGMLSWDEFRLMGLPSELHPQFDATIGALTGEKAEPDRPRDMLAQWETRADFERRNNPDPEAVRKTERVLQVLNWQSQPPLNVTV
jgi:hypothetical protein